jgi:hypothetical protein
MRFFWTPVSEQHSGQRVCRASRVCSVRCWISNRGTAGCHYRGAVCSMAQHHPGNHRPCAGAGRRCRSSTASGRRDTPGSRLLSSESAAGVVRISDEITCNRCAWSRMSAAAVQSSSHGLMFGHGAFDRLCQVEGALSHWQAHRPRAAAKGDQDYPFPFFAALSAICLIMRGNGKRS